MSTIPQSKTLERVLWIKPNVETESLNRSFFRNNLLVENEEDRIFQRPELTHDIFRDKWSGRDAVDEIIDNLAREVLSKLTQDRADISRGYHNSSLKASIQEGFKFSTSVMSERTPFRTTEEREKIRKLVWRTAGGRLKMRTRVPETTGYLDRNYDDELDSFVYALFEAFNVRGTLDIETEIEVTESLQHNHRNYYRGACGSRESGITIYGNDVKENKYLFVKDDTRDSLWSIETYNGIEETPFYNDGLKFKVKFIHPNLTADGREVFESQDIEECRMAKKELKDITNYGMEIIIRGTVPEDFSQADFEFYFNDMWVDLIAELTSMFKKFVKAHSTMVRNFFQKAWGEEQIIPSVLKDVSMYHLDYAGWRPTVLDLDADERDDFSASRFLDFLENPFPSEDAELETLCTLFSFGSSNKKCNLHMMQSVNNAVSQVTDEDIENLIE